jgi:serine/threonine-protein kinase RsbW
MTDQQQIKLKAEVNSLERLWEFITSTCKEYGLVDETINDIQLAVDEACSNIINHGYEGMPDGEMTLSVQFEADQVQIEITDRGRGFNPAEIPPPDINAPMSKREPGGLGWYLIQEVMDSVSYTRTEEINRLVLTKRIHA